MPDQISNIKNQSQVKSAKAEVKYRAFYLAIDVFRFVEPWASKPAYRVIIDQLIRSISSVGANIVEAKASSSRKEFLNYFQVALKSANESIYWLAMLKELIPDENAKLGEFVKETQEIAKIIGSSVLTMKGKRL